jgi:hypothetical protein
MSKTAVTRVTHSCHLIEIGGRTFLTDPFRGSLSMASRRCRGRGERVASRSVAPARVRGPGRRASKGERAVAQGLVAPDGDVGADLEVGSARLVLDLLIALRCPVPQSVDPRDLL